MPVGSRRLAGPVTPTAETIVFTAVSRTRIDAVRVSAGAASSGTFSYSIMPGSTTAATDNTKRLAVAVAVTAGDPVTDEPKQVLEPGDSISAIVSAGLVMHISGVIGLP